LRQSIHYIGCILLAIVLQAPSGPAAGQTSSGKIEKHLSFEMCFARTRIFGQTFPGMSGHYVFFLSHRLGTGLSIFTCQSQINQNFGYSIINPQLLYNQYGWLNQFNLINNKYVKFKLNFTNGLILIRLLDDSQRNYSGQLILQQNFEKNYYYFMAPGTDLSIRLFGLLHLTAGINYRFLFGKSHFSNRKEFQGTAFSFGVTMISSKK
jgi:hypothetical protein